MKNKINDFIMIVIFFNLIIISDLFFNRIIKFETLNHYDTENFRTNLLSDQK